MTAAAYTVVAAIGTVVFSAGFVLGAAWSSRDDSHVRPCSICGRPVRVKG
jgi:hypothetical protein